MASNGAEGVAGARHRWNPASRDAGPGILPLLRPERGSGRVTNLTANAATTDIDDRRRLSRLRHRLFLLVIGITVPLVILAVGAVWQAGVPSASAWRAASSTRRARSPPPWTPSSAMPRSICAQWLPHLRWRPAIGCRSTSRRASPPAPAPSSPSSTRKGGASSTPISASGRAASRSAKRQAGPSSARRCRATAW